jgi:hypothetical protein
LVSQSAAVVLQLVVTHKEVLEVIPLFLVLLEVKLHTVAVAVQVVLAKVKRVLQVVQVAVVITVISPVVLAAKVILAVQVLHNLAHTAQAVAVEAVVLVETDLHHLVVVDQAALV